MVGEGFSQVSDGGAEDLRGGGSGHGHSMGKPRECVRVDQFACPPGDDTVAAVALKVRANIPAVNAGWGPSASLAGFLVEDHMSS